MVFTAAKVTAELPPALPQAWLPPEVEFCEVEAGRSPVPVDVETVAPPTLVKDMVGVAGLLSKS